VKGPPLSNVIALTGKELDPGATNKFIAGAAPGKLALRFSVDEAKVVDAFDFMSFATDTYFSIYGPSRGTEQGEYLETITERPSRTEADWRPGKDGRLSRSCRPATATSLRVALPGVMGTRNAFFPLSVCTRGASVLTIGSVQSGA
jgi:hypothetical protein